MCQAHIEPVRSFNWNRNNMRTSQYLLSTLKETPADAEVISHQLMLRAGMIRKLASGLYTWLPTGVRVLKKSKTSCVKK